MLKVAAVHKAVKMGCEGAPEVSCLGCRLPLPTRVKRKDTRWIGVECVEECVEAGSPKRLSEKILGRKKWREQEQ